MSFKLTSPGSIVGSLFMFDLEGLKSLEMSVRSDDTTFVGDSVVLLTGDAQITRPVEWAVPGGLATGSNVTFVAKVIDFSDFATSDTVKMTVQ